ncbi:unnamed protein product [Rotaria socialis]|uniref:Uncharacterized protein n=1 Tax=Rotaria socialis TaxID=392032 RepID=A0A820MIW4_9BILA|nr:unnamed protein product [Rotaria socialis]CAF3423142.1 unnamed protein product [Rotaria socialis]CAF3522426.1 unnamed protein product [Rotaria socialis]CAF4163641.1 unnamed protein product [Rotaria socialis]CAF4281881.1 unnamed protein product [Rotaria socialis]
MRATLINSLLCCFFIVLLGIICLSSASIDNDEYSLDTDWMDYSSFHPVHALEDRAIHSRFWKRPRHRHFWKRSLVEPSMQNDNTVKSVSKQLQQQNKH